MSLTFKNEKKSPFFPALSVCFGLCFIPVSCSLNAHSIYVGYGQTEQTSTLGQNTLDLNPGGQSVLITFDPSDKVSVYAEYSSLEDDQSINDRLSGSVDIDSLSLGSTYYLDNWSVSGTYTDWQDSLIIDNDQNNTRPVEQTTDANSYSLSLSYDKTFENWLLGVNTGVHYSDWRQNGHTLNRENELNDSVDKGNSTFISVGVSAAHYTSLGADASLMLGGSVGWNQLTDNESTAVLRNGRNISQIANRTIRNFVNFQNIVGSESYGQINLFASFDLTQDWVADFNVAQDFGGEESSTAWSVNLGYQF